MTTLILVLALLTAILSTAANASEFGGSLGDPLPTRIAKTITATWTCQDAIGQKRTRAGNVWQKHSAGYRRWQLRVWQGRLEQCRQWNYRAWLPDKWRRVGICETGLNWRHGNSQYVSAFGIQAGSHNGAYDNDAARVGMPPWASGPSPWAQYQTALSHYNRFGGFSGWGCRGA